MTIISPSILSCDFMNIEKELSYFDEIKDLWLHLDIMDGHFVPNLTFGHPIISKISKITNIPLDAHFMVTNPEFYIDTLKEVNLHNFTFHIEATSKSIELIREAKKYFPSVGISIKPKTELSLLNHEILHEIDLILVMSVEPGFGGQSFIESTWDRLNKIKKLKEENNYQFQVQVDGGVSNKNAKQLIQHGVDNLVAGSYVFKEGPSTYQSKVESLRS